MKKIDKLKHQRYELSMKILDLEMKEKRKNLSKNEERELKILREKLEQLEERIIAIS